MKNNKLKLALRIVALCCVVVFVGYNLYLWNSQSLKGNALPMPFGVGVAIVLSGSMEPTLSVDDMIIVTAVAEYSVDDIVVYQDGSSLVVHRIVSIDGNAVVTKGDANNTTDEPLDISLIKGKVVFWIENVGWVVRLLKTPTVYFSLVGLAILLLENSFRKDKQQESDEIEKLEEQIRQLKARQGE